jgi:hypothetical protein
MRRATISPAADEFERRENEDIVRGAIREAAELGAPLIRISGGFPADAGGA